MDGEYRKRDGDEIVEPLFAALHPEDAGTPRRPRLGRLLLFSALLAGLAVGTWLLVTG